MAKGSSVRPEDRVKSYAKIRLDRMDRIFRSDPSAIEFHQKEMERLTKNTNRLGNQFVMGESRI